MPIRCHRCCLEFRLESEVDEHQRINDRCELRKKEPVEGINKNQERRLKSRKKGVSWPDGGDRWNGVYHISFPDDRDIPSLCESTAFKKGLDCKNVVVN